MKRNDCRKGYSLVELLIVLTVVGMVAVLLLPTFATVSEHARFSQCASNLQQLGKACAAYAADNDTLLPPYPSNVEWLDPSRRPMRPDPDLVNSLKPFTHSREIWRCPDDTIPFGMNPTTYTTNLVGIPRFTSYEYGGVVGGHLKLVPRSIDASVTVDGKVRLGNAATYPLLQDQATCLGNSSPDAGYPSYNHRGLWNRITFDGQLHVFTYDCTDPSSPVEMPVAK